MIDPIMSYAGVMRTEINRMNSIAHNSSNVNTDGFLQEKTYIDKNQFESILRNDHVDTAYSVQPDQKLGTLHITKRPLDIGINSSDWFQVESEAGNLVTRNGHFTLGDDGVLYLGDRKVMGANGPISNVKPGFVVHSDGSIYLGNDFIDKLKLVSLEEKTQLRALGNGVYEANTEVIASTKPTVVQGALMSSNVDIQGDMTKMVEISRHIEMLQRAMSAYSNVLDVGINQIGK